MVPMAMSSVILLFISNILSLIHSAMSSIQSFKLWTRARKSEGILEFRSSHTSDLEIDFPVPTCQAPGVLGSALGMVGPVCVKRERPQFRSTISISVWQHAQLSQQTRPKDTLVCCWDVKLPTNRQSPREALTLP